MANGNGGEVGESMTKETEKTKILTVANGITTLRILGLIALFLIDRTSAAFMIVYTLTGVTDVLDGWIARKTGTAGKFGSALDSVADLLFYAVMLVVFFPVLWQSLSTVIWYFVAAVLVIRVAAYATAAIKYHRFASLHTWLNKLTGAAIFLLPYAIVLSWEGAYSWIVVAIAFAASLEELLMHLTRTAYFPDEKTIFCKQGKEGET